jgi:hypothetical protein
VLLSRHLAHEPGDRGGTLAVAQGALLDPDHEVRGVAGLLREALRQQVVRRLRLRARGSEVVRIGATRRGERGESGEDHGDEGERALPVGRGGVREAGEEGGHAPQ